MGWLGWLGQLWYWFGLVVCLTDCLVLRQALALFCTSQRRLGAVSAPVIVDCPASQDGPFVNGRTCDQQCPGLREFYSGTHLGALYKFVADKIAITFVVVVAVTTKPNQTFTAT